MVRCRNVRIKNFLESLVEIKRELFWKNPSSQIQIIPACKFIFTSNLSVIELLVTFLDILVDTIIEKRH